MRNLSLTSFTVIFLLVGWEEIAVPDIIVGQINRIDPPLGVLVTDSEGRTVQFSDGRIMRLDPDDPNSIAYGEILDDIRQAGIPVYAEFDPKNGTITLLRIPLIVVVTDIVRTESGNLQVELEISSARHTLSSTNSDFACLWAILEDARQRHVQVAVTETEDHEIIDVRSYTLR
jgi:hypothetical protein